MSRKRKKLDENLITAYGRPLRQKYERIWRITSDRMWLFRQELGLSQAQMAAECGVSAGVIGALERGYGLATGVSLRKVAEGCGMSVNFILGLEERARIEKAGKMRMAK